jgi:hypothetical protein
MLYAFLWRIFSDKAYIETNNVHDKLLDLEGATMVERKAALKRAQKRPELEALLEQAKTRVVSDDELRAQRASFVYGNAPSGSRITRESAIESVSRLRVIKVPA